MRSVVVAMSAVLVFSSAAFAAPAVGLPSDTFVRTWMALPTTRFVQETPVQVRLLKARTADVPADLFDEAFTSARDGLDRRDVTFLEMSTSWPQPLRRALWDARDAESRYAAAAASFTPEATRGERFAALVRQIDGGEGRSAASAESVEEADAGVGPAYAAAFDRMDAARQDALRESQTAWLAYREAVLTFAAARSPGLVPAVRRRMDETRTAQLSSIAR